MPFNFYRRLNKRQRAIYRRSDEIVAVNLPDAAGLLNTVSAIEQALGGENRAQVQQLSARLALSICRQLDIATLEVEVLTRRPSDDWGELHGLYEPLDAGKIAHITVWMRTAKRRQVVAFKTYLRTLLHEIGHHLDYEYFNLQESFHTEGFYKRENHLFKLLTVNPILVRNLEFDWDSSG